MNVGRPVGKWIEVVSIGVFLLSILLIVSGCGGINPSKGETRGTTDAFSLESGGINGQVTGSGSVPISGAIIEAGDRQATSGTDGKYLLGGLHAGDYQVVARSGGYAPGQLSGVRVFAGMITKDVNFSLASGVATVSRDFSVIAVTPAFGTDGDIVGVLGTGLGSTPGKVKIGDKFAQILDWNSKGDGFIQIRVPGEVETGRVKVIIGSEESHEIQAVNFTGKPFAVKASPPSGKAGSKITITGRNFNPVPGFNSVTLNGLVCQVVAAGHTAKQMNVILPPNCTSGTFTVRIASNEYQLDGFSTAYITILAELVHLSPKRSIPGITLTLYGKNFGTDKSRVKVWLGEKKALQGTDILSFSNTRISFSAPDSSVLQPGESIPIRVAINDFKTDAITYTSYDTSLATLKEYGIYNFADVSSGNVLRIASLKSTDHIAFVSVTSANGTIELGDTYDYTVYGCLGGNTEPVPNLPAGSIRPVPRIETIPYSRDRRDVGPLVRSWAAREARHARNREESAVRPAISEPAPATASFYLVNFGSASPEDPNNDILASAALAATGKKCLVYLDLATNTAVTASSAEVIAAWFDDIYATIATACWDGVSTPPEGNVDAQSRILLFLSPRINQGVSGNLVTLGYFYPRDKDSTKTHSAGTEILYLWDRTFNSNPEDFCGVLAHELAHMMYYNQKGITEGVTWLDEGLSCFAQQVVGYGLAQGRATPVMQVAAYLDNPQNVSLNHWPDSAGIENYGMSFLFVQYLFERGSGYSAIRALEKRNGSVGFVDVENNIILAGLLGTATENLASFLHEFSLAMYCDEIGFTGSFKNFRPGVHEFPGIKLRNSFSGLRGLRHLVYGENPVPYQVCTIKGYGCDVFEYFYGNGGDLEVQLPVTPTIGDFKTWVIYYSEP